MCFKMCRHRGMILVEKSRTVRGPITCPYHARAYDLDGNLLKTLHIDGPNINTLDSVQHFDFPLIRIRSRVWNDMILVNVGEVAPAFDLYAADLMARWQEFDQTLYHGGADSSLSLQLECNLKLVVENYCKAYHLPFIHPSLNTCSRLEDHYNILDNYGVAGQGTTAYQPQINSDGCHFPRF